jgi:hypothetical protein
VTYPGPYRRLAWDVYIIAFASVMLPIAFWVGFVQTVREGLARRRRR